MELSPYTNLTKKQWMSILYDYLFSTRDDQFTFSDPKLERHVNLINLYEALEPPDRRTMKEGMTWLLKDTPASSENNFILYYIIHFCIATKPVHAQAPLVSLYKSGLLKKRFVGNQNLHQLVLLACSKYPLSKELIKSIEWSLVADNDLNYTLLCVRILSDYSSESAVKYFSLIYPKIETITPELSLKLSSIVARTGIDDIYEWVIRTWDEVPNGLYSNYETFLTALNQAVPWRQLVNMNSKGHGLTLILSNFSMPPKMASLKEIIIDHHSGKIDDKIFKTVWTVLVHVAKRTWEQPVRLISPDLLEFMKKRPDSFSLFGVIENSNATIDEEMLSVETYEYQYNMLTEILGEIDKRLVTI